jgi:hypothetical protein
LLSNLYKLNISCLFSKLSGNLIKRDAMFSLNIPFYVESNSLCIIAEFEVNVIKVWEILVKMKSFLSIKSRTVLSL